MLRSYFFGCVLSPRWRSFAYKPGIHGQDTPKTLKHDKAKTARPKMIDGGFVFIIAIAVISAILVWVVKGQTVFWAIIDENLLFAAALMPKILGGVLVASILPLLLPREKVQQWIGPESGIFGLCAATLAGAVIPGGPSVTLPLAGGLMAAGADLGAGIAIVTGWALLGLNRTLIWELSFLPPHLIFLRFALCLVFPVILGWAVRRLHLELRERA